MHVLSLSFQLQSCTPDLLLRGWLWTDRSCFSSDTIPQVHTRPVYRLFIGLWNCNIKMFLWHGSQIWSHSLLRNYFVCWPDQQTLSQRSEEIRPAVTHTDTDTDTDTHTHTHTHTHRWIYLTLVLDCVFFTHSISQVSFYPHFDFVFIIFIYLRNIL